MLFQARAELDGQAQGSSSRRWARSCATKAACSLRCSTTSSTPPDRRLRAGSPDGNQEMMGGHALSEMLGHGRRAGQESGMSSALVRLIAQRIVLGILLMLAVSVLIFVGTQILPGDVAPPILGQSATPEALANLPHGSRPRPSGPCPLCPLARRRPDTAISAPSLANQRDIVAELLGRASATRCSSPACRGRSPCRWRSSSASSRCAIRERRLRPDHQRHHARRDLAARILHRLSADHLLRGADSAGFPSWPPSRRHVLRRAAVGDRACRR